MGQAVPAGWTGQWLIHGIAVVPFKSASAPLSTTSYRQLCSCLEADKKATTEALSFLPRGTAGASRVTLISGLERVFLWALVIPLVKERELPHRGFSAGWKLYEWHIHLLYFVSFFCVQVKILVNFPRKFTLMRQKCSHRILRGTACSWHPLGVKKLASY